MEQQRYRMAHYNDELWLIPVGMENEVYRLWRAGEPFPPEVKFVNAACFQEVTFADPRVE